MADEQEESGTRRVIGEVDRSQSQKTSQATEGEGRGQGQTDHSFWVRPSTVFTKYLLEGKQYLHFTDELNELREAK